VAGGDGDVLDLDLASGRIVRRVHVGGVPSAVVVAPAPGG
jgi:hypothetical protein